MMGTMPKIHVNGSILCLQKLPLFSWLGKPLQQSSGNDVTRGPGEGPDFSSPSLGLGFLICTPGSRTLLCSCKIQIRVKVRTTCVQVQHHPELLIINRGRRVILWLSHPTRQKIHRRRGFYNTGLLCKVRQSREEIVLS